MTNYVPHPVETKADIDKKIDIEAANIMYFEYKNKEEAFKEARYYIENKYHEIILSLKNKGLY